MNGIHGLVHWLLLPVSKLIEWYARWSSHSVFNIREALPGVGERVEKPLVMLVTGSLIVSDFFDTLAARLAGEGFRVVVYQPEDLLTVSLEKSAHDIDRAVKSVLALTGDEKLMMIAECNGGVASRYWLARLGGNRYVDRLITFVSAHHGTIPAAIPVCSSFEDVQRGSPFIRVMDEAGLPDDAEMVSIYMKGDEAMYPRKTSVVEGAVNIEVRDREMFRRAQARRFRPPRVHQLMGDVMNRISPVHFAGFFDDRFHDLLVSCLKDDIQTVKAFDGFEVEVS